MSVGTVWGRQLSLALFGESHGPGIGVVIGGLPPGEDLDLGKIEAFMARRAPGKMPWSSLRRERDQVRILSGVYRGKTTGTPLGAMIENEDQSAEDYPETMIARPGHADYSGMIRYGGANDPRGGGHFSGRLTAPLCFAGALCRGILGSRKITIAARILEVGGISDRILDLARPDLTGLEQVASKDFPVLDDHQGRQMIAEIEQARRQGDSLGGVVQCFVLGLPAGLGDPLFGSVESHLSSILYAIPAVKGVSFGAGFAASRSRGSENNDLLYLDDLGQVRTRTNHDGGINGGVTNGMPVVFNVGFKPPSSIAQGQRTLNLRTGKAEQLTVKGRHDPCVVPRAVVAVEGAAALAVLDLFLVSQGIWPGGEHRWS